jgi:hypothetical protein
MKKWFPLALAVLALVASPLWAKKGPEIGKAAPDFKLTDVDGKTHSLSDFKGKYVVLEWINHGCPFVVKHYDSGNMQALQKESTGKGVVWLSISSSAKGKQGHMSPGGWRTSASTLTTFPGSPKRNEIEHEIRTVAAAGCWRPRGLPRIR